MDAGRGGIILCGSSFCVRYFIARHEWRVSLDFFVRADVMTRYSMGGDEDSSIPRENAEELGPYFDYHPGKVCRIRIWNDCWWSCVWGGVLDQGGDRGTIIWGHIVKLFLTADYLACSWSHTLASGTLSLKKKNVMFLFTSSQLGVLRFGERDHRGQIVKVCLISTRFSSRLWSNISEPLIEMHMWFLFVQLWHYCPT
jgi:hypothetical protein